MAHVGEKRAFGAVRFFGGVFRNLKLSGDALHFLRNQFAIHDFLLQLFVRLAQFLRARRHQLFKMSPVRAQFVLRMLQHAQHFIDCAA